MVCRVTGYVSSRGMLTIKPFRRHLSKGRVPVWLGLLALGLFPGPWLRSSAAQARVEAAPVSARSSGGMVVSTNLIASRIGADVLKAGGNAVDAAVKGALEQGLPG